MDEGKNSDKDKNEDVPYGNFNAGLKSENSPTESSVTTCSLSGPHNFISSVEGLISLSPALTQSQDFNAYRSVSSRSTDGNDNPNVSQFETPSWESSGSIGKIRKKQGSKYHSDIQIREEKLMCGVCGDRALGCNFDAISCESCKAFFRRNAMKDKKTKCLFDGNCKIDVNTRRFCPHCRLKKCFEIGMKKEFILGDDEKKKRMAKVIQNKQRKVTGKDSDTSDIPISPLSPVSMINSLAGNDLPASQSCSSIQTPVHVTLEIPAGSTESVNLLSLSRFVKTNDSFNVPMDSYLVRRLTTEESSMLQELMQVYDLSFTVDLEPLIHIKQVDPSLNQLVNQSSVTVLRIIKFAKRLEEFVRLPQECQIGILKGCWINILLLRSVSVYDSERDIWLTPRGEIPTNILKNATGFVRLHDDHVKYCKSIKSIIKDDLTIVVLLIVTVLFAPEGPHVVTRELVSNIQDKYLVLLKHYLESKYMYGRAAEMFPQLMSKMKELKELAEDHGKYLLDVNPNEIEPIMLEILDLK